MKSARNLSEKHTRRKSPFSAAFCAILRADVFTQFSRTFHASFHAPFHATFHVPVHATFHATFHAAFHATFHAPFHATVLGRAVLARSAQKFIFFLTHRVREGRGHDKLSKESSSPRDPFPGAGALRPETWPTYVSISVQPFSLCQLPKGAKLQAVVCRSKPPGPWLRWVC